MEHMTSFNKIEKFPFVFDSKGKVAEKISNQYF